MIKHENSFLSLILFALFLINSISLNGMFTTPCYTQRVKKTIIFSCVRQLEPEQIQGRTDALKELGFKARLDAWFFFDNNDRKEILAKYILQQLLTLVMDSITTPSNNRIAELIIE